MLSFFKMKLFFRLKWRRLNRYHFIFSVSLLRYFSIKFNHKLHEWEKTTTTKHMKSGVTFKCTHQLFHVWNQNSFCSMSKTSAQPVVQIHDFNFHVLCQQASCKWHWKRWSNSLYNSTTWCMEYNFRSM